MLYQKHSDVHIHFAANGGTGGEIGFNATRTHGG